MLGDDTTTEKRLRLLQAEFTQHQRREPGDGRTATRTTSPAPLDLNVFDRIRAAVNEVVEHTRTAAPDAGPIPADETRIYDWSRQHTAHLNDERQQARETFIYRQGSRARHSHGRYHGRVQAPLPQLRLLGPSLAVRCTARCLYQPVLRRRRRTLPLLAP